MRLQIGHYEFIYIQETYGFRCDEATPQEKLVDFMVYRSHL